MHPRVKALVDRAKAANVSFDELAPEAQLSRSKLYRWANGKSAKVEDLDRAEAALDRMVKAKAEALASLAAAS